MKGKKSLCVFLVCLIASGAALMTGCTVQNKTSYQYRLYGVVSGEETQDGISEVSIAITNLDPGWYMDKTLYQHEIFGIEDYRDTDVFAIMSERQIPSQTGYEEKLAYDETDEALVSLLRTSREEQLILKLTVSEGRIVSAEQVEYGLLPSVSYKNNVIYEMMPLAAHEISVLRENCSDETFEYDVWETYSGETYFDFIYSWYALKDGYQTANYELTVEGNAFVYYICLNEAEDYGQILLTSDQNENFLISGNLYVDEILGVLSYTGDGRLRVDVSGTEGLSQVNRCESFLFSSFFASDRVELSGVNKRITYEAMGVFDYYRLFTYDSIETGLVETEPLYLYLDEFCASQEMQGRIFRLQDETVVHLLGIDVEENRLEYITENGTWGSVWIPLDGSEEMLFH